MMASIIFYELCGFYVCTFITLFYVSSLTLNPVHTNNNVEATLSKGNFVVCCFDNVAVLGNNVEATFDFVERTKFQRKPRSTLLPFLATKSNVALTLLLVWTGLYVYCHVNCGFYRPIYSSIKPSSKHSLSTIGNVAIG